VALFGAPYHKFAKAGRSTRRLQVAVAPWRDVHRGARARIGEERTSGVGKRREIASNPPRHSARSRPVTVVRTEHAGEVFAGRHQQQRIGTVTVRIEDSAPGVDPGLGDLISLEYRGSNADATHWLQFVWSELEATTATGRVRRPGILTVDGVDRPLTPDPSSPVWTVDTLRPRNVPAGWRPLFPWYEGGARHGGPGASNQGYSVLGPGLRKIYDRPGGPAVISFVQPLLDGVPWASARWTCHFVTYLMVAEDHHFRARYAVQWYAFVDLRRGSGAVSASRVDYRTEKAGPCGRPRYGPIAAPLLSAVRQEFPDYRGIE
jgi:hypothetical protein